MKATILLLVFMGSIGIARAQENQKLKREIETIQAIYEAAVPVDDIDKIMKLYEDDAVYLPAQGGILSGKKAIRTQWLKTLSMNILAFDLETVELSQSGDFVTVVGKTTASIEMKGDTMAIKTKYLNVWKRQSNGDLKLHRGIYNPLTETKP